MNKIVCTYLDKKKILQMNNKFSNCHSFVYWNFGKKRKIRYNAKNKEINRKRKINRYVDRQIAKQIDR